jgi:hypothetical protein
MIHSAVQVQIRAWLHRSFALLQLVANSAPRIEVALSPKAVIALLLAGVSVTAASHMCLRHNKNGASDPDAFVIEGMHGFGWCSLF